MILCGLTSLIRAGLRRVFTLNVLAALSLLLGIGLGCLWPRTIRVDDTFQYVRSSGQWVSFGTVPRALWFSVFTQWGNIRVHPLGWNYYHCEWTPERSPRILVIMSNDRWLGFNVSVGDQSDSTRGYHIVEAKIPLWFPMVLTLVLPLGWVRRWRRQARRVRLGLCLQCGYDTRATPDPAGPRLPRCPECGQKTASSRPPPTAPRPPEP